MARWLTVIGIGENGYEGLGKQARRALLTAAHIIGAPRQLELLPHCLKASRQPWPSPFTLEPVWARRGEPTCVLASGDPMLFGVGASLGRQVEPHEWTVLPAPSSFSLAAARLGWPLQDVELLSVVARPASGVNRYLHEGRRLLVLSQDGQSPAQLADLLRQAGFGASRLWVLEHLGGPLERMTDGIARDWPNHVHAALNVVAIECRCETALKGYPLTAGLPDESFENDGQLTKRDIRALTLSRLAPRPQELLWDVGAGCGSIGIEWMRSHPSCRAVAIEANATRQAMILSNRDTLGVPSLSLIAGRAPEALEGLEPPDAIFVGGGVTVPGMLDACWTALKPGGRLVANAVTLQSEAELVRWRETHGGELIRMQLAHAKPLGGFDTWRSALPITLLCVAKP
ncbi:precorrin-6y C5,15-methyltransferase (decarboxylating) subunit CbiE [Pseudomonas sp. Marseille-QA0892]